MSVLWMYLKVFLVGGALCAVGELLVLRTRLTPARILVCYIIAGVLLSAIGVYGPLADFAGCGRNRTPYGLWTCPVSGRDGRRG